MLALFIILQIIFFRNLVIIDFFQSQLTSRLATIHRGVVKALQMLVKQMSDIGSHKSIPRGYHDLAVIIRQLSISCAQLEVTTESVVTDDVLSLLKDIVVNIILFNFIIYQLFAKKRTNQSYVFTFAFQFQPRDSQFFMFNKIIFFFGVIIIILKCHFLPR